MFYLNIYAFSKKNLLTVFTKIFFKNILGKINIVGYDVRL